MIGQAGRVARVEGMGNSYKILFGNSQRKETTWDIQAWSGV